MRSATTPRPIKFPATKTEPGTCVAPTHRHRSATHEREGRESGWAKDWPPLWQGRRQTYRMNEPQYFVCVPNQPPCSHKVIRRSRRGTKKRKVFQPPPAQPRRRACLPACASFSTEKPRLCTTQNQSNTAAAHRSTVASPPPPHPVPVQRAAKESHSQPHSTP